MSSVEASWTSLPQKASFLPPPDQILPQEEEEVEETVEAPGGGRGMNATSTPPPLSRITPPGHLGKTPLKTPTGHPRAASDLWPGQYSATSGTGELLSGSKCAPVGRADGYHSVAGTHRAAPLTPLLQYGGSRHTSQPKIRSALGAETSLLDTSQQSVGPSVVIGSTPAIHGVRSGALLRAFDHNHDETFSVNASLSRSLFGIADPARGESESAGRRRRGGSAPPTGPLEPSIPASLGEAVTHRSTNAAPPSEPIDAKASAETGPSADVLRREIDASPEGGEPSPAEDWEQTPQEREAPEPYTSSPPYPVAEPHDSERVGLRETAEVKHELPAYRMPPELAKKTKSPTRTAPDFILVEGPTMRQEEEAERIAQLELEEEERLLWRRQIPPALLLGQLHGHEAVPPQASAADGSDTGPRPVRVVDTYPKLQRLLYAPTPDLAAAVVIMHLEHIPLFFTAGDAAGPSRPLDTPMSSAPRRRWARAFFSEWLPHSFPSLEVLRLSHMHVNDALLQCLVEGCFSQAACQRVIQAMEGASGAAAAPPAALALPPCPATATALTRRDPNQTPAVVKSAAHTSPQGGSRSRPVAQPPPPSLPTRARGCDPLPNMLVQRHARRLPSRSSSSSGPEHVVLERRALPHLRVLDLRHNDLTAKSAVWLGRWLLLAATTLLPCDSSSSAPPPSQPPARQADSKGGLEELILMGNPLLRDAGLQVLAVYWNRMNEKEEEIVWQRRRADEADTRNSATVGTAGRKYLTGLLQADEAAPQSPPRRSTIGVASSATSCLFGVPPPTTTSWLGSFQMRFTLRYVDLSHCGATGGGLLRAVTHLSAVPSVRCVQVGTQGVKIRAGAGAPGREMVREVEPRPKGGPHRIASWKGGPLLHPRTRLQHLFLSGTASLATRYTLLALRELLLDLWTGTGLVVSPTPQRRRRAPPPPPQRYALLKSYTPPEAVDHSPAAPQPGSADKTAQTAAAKETGGAGTVPSPAAADPSGSVIEMSLSRGATEPRHPEATPDHKSTFISLTNNSISFAEHGGTTPVVAAAAPAAGSASHSKSSVSFFDEGTLPSEIGAIPIRRPSVPPFPHQKGGRPAGAVNNLNNNANNSTMFVSISLSGAGIAPATASSISIRSVTPLPGDPNGTPGQQRAPEESHKSTGATQSEGEKKQLQQHTPVGLHQHTAGLETGGVAASHERPFPLRTLDLSYSFDRSDVPGEAISALLLSGMLANYMYTAMPFTRHFAAGKPPQTEKRDVVADVLQRASRHSQHATVPPPPAAYLRRRYMEEVGWRPFAFVDEVVMAKRGRRPTGGHVAVEERPDSALPEPGEVLPYYNLCRWMRGGGASSLLSTLSGRGSAGDGRESILSSQPTGTWLETDWLHGGRITAEDVSAVTAGQLRVGDVCCELLHHASYAQCRFQHFTPLPMSFTHLHTLQLAHTGLSDHGARALCLAVAMSRGVSAARAGQPAEAGASAAPQLLLLHHLRVLDLSGNFLTPIGCLRVLHTFFPAQSPAGDPAAAAAAALPMSATEDSSQSPEGDNTALMYTASTMGDGADAAGGTVNSSTLRPPPSHPRSRTRSRQHQHPHLSLQVLWMEDEAGIRASDVGALRSIQREVEKAVRASQGRGTRLDIRCSGYGSPLSASPAMGEETEKHNTATHTPTRAARDTLPVVPASRGHPSQPAADATSGGEKDTATRPSAPLASSMGTGIAAGVGLKEDEPAPPPVPHALPLTAAVSSSVAVETTVEVMRHPPSSTSSGETQPVALAPTSAVTASGNGAKAQHHRPKPEREILRADDSREEGKPLVSSTVSYPVAIASSESLGDPLPSAQQKGEKEPLESHDPAPIPGARGAPSPVIQREESKGSVSQSTAPAVAAFREEGRTTTRPAEPLPAGDPSARLEKGDKTRTDDVPRSSTAPPSPIPPAQSTLETAAPIPTGHAWHSFSNGPEIPQGVRPGDADVQAAAGVPQKEEMQVAPASLRTVAAGEDGAAISSSPVEERAGEADVILRDPLDDPPAPVSAETRSDSANELQEEAEATRQLPQTDATTGGHETITVEEPSISNTIRAAPHEEAEKPSSPSPLAAVPIVSTPPQVNHPPTLQSQSSEPAIAEGPKAGLETEWIQELLSPSTSINEEVEMDPGVLDTAGGVSSAVVDTEPTPIVTPSAALSPPSPPPAPAPVIASEPPSQAAPSPQGSPGPIPPTGQGITEAETAIPLAGARLQTPMREEMNPPNRPVGSPPPRDPRSHLHPAAPGLPVVIPTTVHTLMAVQQKSATPRESTSLSGPRLITPEDGDEDEEAEGFAWGAGAQAASNVGLAALQTVSDHLLHEYLHQHLQREKAKWEARERSAWAGPEGLTEVNPSEAMRSLPPGCAAREMSQEPPKMEEDEEPCNAPPAVEAPAVPLGDHQEGRGTETESTATATDAGGFHKPRAGSCVSSVARWYGPPNARRYRDHFHACGGYGLYRPPYEFNNGSEEDEEEMKDEDPGRCSFLVRGARTLSNGVHPPRYGPLEDEVHDRHDELREASSVSPVPDSDAFFSCLSQSHRTASQEKGDKGSELDPVAAAPPHPEPPAATTQAADGDAAAAGNEGPMAVLRRSTCTPPAPGEGAAALVSIGEVEKGQERRMIQLGPATGTGAEAGDSKSTTATATPCKGLQHNALDNLPREDEGDIATPRGARRQRVEREDTRQSLTEDEAPQTSLSAPTFHTGQNAGAYPILHLPDLMGGDEALRDYLRRFTRDADASNASRSESPAANPVEGQSGASLHTALLGSPSASLSLSLASPSHLMVLQGIQFGYEYLLRWADLPLHSSAAAAFASRVFERQHRIFAGSWGAQAVSVYLAYASPAVSAGKQKATARAGNTPAMKVLSPTPAAYLVLCLEKKRLLRSDTRVPVLVHPLWDIPEPLVHKAKKPTSVEVEKGAPAPAELEAAGLCTEEDVGLMFSVASLPAPPSTSSPPKPGQMVSAVRITVNRRGLTAEQSAAVLTQATSSPRPAAPARPTISTLQLRRTLVQGALQAASKRKIKHWVAEHEARATRKRNDTMTRSDLAVSSSEEGSETPERAAAALQELLHRPVNSLDLYIGHLVSILLRTGLPPPSFFISPLCSPSASATSCRTPLNVPRTFMQRGPASGSEDLLPAPHKLGPATVTPSPTMAPGKKEDELRLPAFDLDAAEAGSRRYHRKKKKRCIVVDITVRSLAEAKKAVQALQDAQTSAACVAFAHVKRDAKADKAATDALALHLQQPVFLFLGRQRSIFLFFSLLILFSPLACTISNSHNNNHLHNGLWQIHCLKLQFVWERAPLLFFFYFSLFFPLTHPGYHVF
eukprot:gene3945-2808_t